VATVLGAAQPRRVHTGEALDAQLAAAVAFVVTFIPYFLGAGRSLDFDSSITVGKFVATPSLLDPFRPRGQSLNNHPLFSFADHIVYSLGGHSEAALRVLPVAFGAAGVAVLTWWCARRLGLLAGAAAAAVTAANPLLASLSREVRGYSLLVLCAIVATIALERLVTRPTRRTEIIYVLSLAIGVGTHLYGTLVVATHVAAVFGRFGRRQPIRVWLYRWVLACGLGLIPYVAIARQMWDSRAGRALQPHFPLDLAQALLGSHPLAMAAVAALLVVGVAVIWPPSRPALTAVAALLLVITGIWLLVQPVFLYTRFFVWLVPAVGLVAAIAVARWPGLVLLAALCVLSTVISESGGWTRPALPIRTAGNIVRHAADSGYRSCSMGFNGASLTAYSPQPQEIHSASELAGCDLAIGWEQRAPAGQAPTLLRYHVELDNAHEPFELYSRVPLAQLGAADRG
jgi:hypothetical protein